MVCRAVAKSSRQVVSEAALEAKRMRLEIEFEIDRGADRIRRCRRRAGIDREARGSDALATGCGRGGR